MKIMTALILLLVSAAPSVAARACPQEKASYEGSDGYGLIFKPLESNAAAAVQRFELRQGDVRFTGYVMESEAPSRSIVHIEKDCPEGDVTGEDLAACTLYEGYAYALPATGGEGMVGPAGSAAADGLLFTGFGPALANSPLAEKLKLKPPARDLFTFKDCAP